MPQVDSLFSITPVVSPDTNRPASSSGQVLNQPDLFRFSDSDSTSGFGREASFYRKIKVFFTGHVLQPVNAAPITFYRRTPDWFTLGLVVVVIAFTWIRVFYSKIFKQLVGAFFSNSISNQIVRDENILVQRASILMSFIFYLTASLFIYQIIDFFKWSNPLISDGLLRFILICLAVAFTYSFKMVLLKGLGEVFGIDKPVATYIFNIFLINNILGIALIPIVVGIAYVATVSTALVAWIGVGLVIIAFIYRLVRAFSIWLTLNRVSFFYLILYFCTLEIAPLVILVKLVQG
ncbi:MAG: DUF4271 domain-containing protein [Bacteroidetes bacterium]|nr:DUF4271 domain-containing protein [Bacteroidota bacterium]